MLRYLRMGAALAVLIGVFVAAATGVGQSPVTAQRFVDLQQGANPHEGFRRAHAKGFCIAGEFQSNGSLAPYSTAEVFQEGSTSFVGRMSIAGANPTAPDLRSPVRSLALSFGSGGSESWRTAMNTPPVMAVANPEDFFAQLQALAPDPTTGQADRARIAQFFADHPETQAFRAWQASYTPTASFATERYHSINAFYLISSQGQRQPVRWAAVPTVGNESAVPLTEDDPDALQSELMSRLRKGAVRFEFVFTLAEPDDDENDPTTPWPAQRRQISAGELWITHAVAQAQGECNHINFDPLVLPAGMAATSDRILLARSAAYAESYRRRARETLFGQGSEPAR